MNPRSILVTGGAGYIGSHCVRRLSEDSYSPVVVDNLRSGHRWAVPREVPFVDCDAGDGERIGAVIRQHEISAVMHFAGHVVAPESIADPLSYYRNNTCVSRNLIETCLRHDVRDFIFSSTAAVYGDPAQSPVRETAPTRPITPYGSSKLMTEWILRDVAASLESDTGRASAEHGKFRYIALRYFNVAGARLDGTAGQSTPNATHLVKVAAEAACGARPGVEIFGNDYATRDGTCIRDYIHVEDLVDAHVAALRHLQAGSSSGTYNCGYGHGHTVREVLAAMQEVSGVRLKLFDGPRRPGDPKELVADPSCLKRDLQWVPRLNDLRVICESAYRWQRRMMEQRT